MTACCFYSCQEKSVSPEKKITQTLQLQIDSFNIICSKLQSAAVSGTSTDDQLQNLFLQARMRIKN
jgi:hypothetical protein